MKDVWFVFLIYVILAFLGLGMYLFEPFNGRAILICWCLGLIMNMGLTWRSSDKK